jgi:hypothetical protein
MRDARLVQSCEQARRSRRVSLAHLKLGLSERSIESPLSPAQAHHIPNGLTAHEVIDVSAVKDGFRKSYYPRIAGAEDSDEPNVWIYCRTVGSHKRCRQRTQLLRCTE